MTPDELKQLAQQVQVMQSTLAAEQSHQHIDGPAIHINPASGYAREMRKWEATHTQYGPPGRPYVYHEYPHAMFKAGHPEDRVGKIVIQEFRDAGNDTERESMERMGFRATQEAAIALVEQWDLEMKTAAAERAFTERTMSQKAQKEAEAVDASTMRHVPEVKPGSRRQDS